MYSSHTVPLNQHPDGGWTHQVQADKAYQDSVLPGVSRTFALTIPQLPEYLRGTVTNAYLLCRIADTIEDHLPGDSVAKAEWFKRLDIALRGQEPAEPFGRELARMFPRQSTPRTELELVRNTHRVLRVTRALPAWQRRSVVRCVRVLAEGMARFQANKRPDGLADITAFDDYCYHVAGVVGEMLTVLFCGYSTAMGRHRQELMRLSLSFGQALQMTNILKDVWNDRERGVCWLPRDIFAGAGCPLDADADWAGDPRFHEGMRRMVAIARGHLDRGFEYVLQIPVSEPGIRRFCIWALGMAALTLGNIHRHPQFRDPAEIKISRRTVRGLMTITPALVRRDWLLKASYAAATRRLPPADVRPAHNPAHGGPAGR
ncbi:phytoene/squalene synthase family protein [Alkalilimnicola ehrlichii]|uniref:phytoene/squalene synthase family protein n=1 Tax=Alkalilimnicola ehrlichii TaxID=351052 RepID=UPI003B9E577B